MPAQVCLESQAMVGVDRCCHLDIMLSIRWDWSSPCSVFSLRMAYVMDRWTDLTTQFVIIRSASPTSCMFILCHLFLLIYSLSLSYICLLFFVRQMRYLKERLKIGKGVLSDPMMAILMRFYRLIKSIGNPDLVNLKSLYLDHRNSINLNSGQRSNGLHGPGWKINGFQNLDHFDSD